MVAFLRDRPVVPHKIIRLFKPFAISFICHAMTPSDPAIHPDSPDHAGADPDEESSPPTPIKADKDEEPARSSSSSDDSCASFDPFQFDEHEIANSSSAADTQDKLETMVDSTSVLDQDDIIIDPYPSLLLPEQTDKHPIEASMRRTSSGGSRHSSSSDESITQSPPIQVMERTGDLDSDRPVPYRIPSSVFARNPSATPHEWSTTSNESVFSIQMGNSSFSKDKSWMYKSGELGKTGEPLVSPLAMDYSSNQALPPLTDYSSNQPPPPWADLSASNPQPPMPARNSIDIFKTNTDFDQGLRDNPEAVETMKSVLRENAEVNNDKDQSPHAGRSSCQSFEASPSHCSTASGASAQSFAFAVIGGDGAKSGSSKVSPSSTEQNPDPESPKPESPQKAETSKASAPIDIGISRWFTCLSRCHFCCCGSTEQKAIRLYKP